MTPTLAESMLYSIATARAERYVSEQMKAGGIDLSSAKIPDPFIAKMLKDLIENQALHELWKLGYSFEDN